MSYVRCTVVAACLAALAGAPGARAGPLACNTVSQADAAKWLGGPLETVHRSEQKPEPSNGRDHATNCGYFPKGYDLKTADAPPPRGLLVQLHSMPDAAAATGFYDAMTSMAPPGAPPPTVLPGIGEAAVIEPVRVQGSNAKIFRVSFRKKSIAGSVQVWSSSGSPDEIARAAAKHVVAKLP